VLPAQGIARYAICVKGRSPLTAPRLMPAGEPGAPPRQASAKED